MSATALIDEATSGGAASDPSVFVTRTKEGQRLDLMVEGARCGACLAKIEKAVGGLPGVRAARLNLSTGRLHVEWTGGLRAKSITAALSDLGYPARAFEEEAAGALRREEERRLLVAMAVAGLASAGVMLLSEAVWFGADLSPETRTLLYWLSALIAIPATAFAGRPFLASAFASISQGRLNMDVPISLAVIMAVALSLYETAAGGRHAYFDASVMLLFFLLIGRFLDARLRRQAYAAVNALASLGSASATRIESGRATPVRAADIRPGDMLLLAAGERLVADAEVVDGESSVDVSLVTGESEPLRVSAGEVLHAGSINLSAPLRVRASAAAENSLMAEIGRMLEAGEQKKSRYRYFADKAAEIYVPLVHVVALAGFAGWLLLGTAIAKAAFIAMSVLIITCPCAMALAAPMVQVVAASRLFREGAYLASGQALERLAGIDHVVFDKTGTLTLGDLVLASDLPPAVLEQAAQLARASRHPYARAIARAAGAGPVAVAAVERPGEGVEGLVDGRLARLGSAVFAGGEPGSSGLWLSIEGERAVHLRFEEAVRPDLYETIGALRRRGLGVELLSGDAPDRVRAIAEAAGIEVWSARATPQSKVRRLQELERAGRRVLMVGDGLNDAGAIAAAHASLAPGGAVDVTRLAADCVFGCSNLGVIVHIIDTARTARRRMLENFAFAVAYNLVAVPVALLGWATPLVAALAMSGSSAIVTLNALRMAGGGRQTGSNAI